MTMSKREIIGGAIGMVGMLLAIGGVGHTDVTGEWSGVFLGIGGIGLLGLGVLISNL